MANAKLFYLFVVVLLLLDLRCSRKHAFAKSKKRRFWIHPIFQGQQETGTCYSLVSKLTDMDLHIFFGLIRLSPKNIWSIVRYIKTDDRKTNKFGPSFPSDGRLTITLHFLASSKSQISLSYNIKFGKLTVYGMIDEMC